MHPLLPNRWLERGRVMLFAMVFAGAANSATTSITLGLDTDASGATGCSLATATGPQPGIERRVTITVTTNAATGSVGPVTIASCTGSTFGPESSVSPGAWATGMGLGVGASDVIESQVPLSLLGNPSVARIFATTAGDRLPDGLVAFPAVAQPVQEIPVLSGWGLVLLAGLVAGALGLMQRRARSAGASLFAAALVCLTLAAVEAITLDGNPIDWAGDPPVSTDPAGDAVPGQDLIALFAKPDGVNLALRIDMKLALDPVSPPGNLAPVIVLAATQNVSLPSNALLAASVSDDAKPVPPGTVTLAWSVVSKPVGSAVTFSSTTVGESRRSGRSARQLRAELTASDGALSSSATITLTAAQAANAAAVVGPLADRTVRVGRKSLAFTVPVNDPDPWESVTFSIVSGPPGASLAPTTSRNFRFTPTVAQIGTHPVTIEARDARGSTSRASFALTVIASNLAPVFAALTDDVTAVGANYRKTLSATDAEGGALTFALAEGPAGMALAGNVLAWTPTNAQLGTHIVKVSVSDPGGAKAAAMFRVVVGANSVPRARDDSYTARVGVALNVPARGVLGNDVDPDGEALTARKTSDPTLGSLSAFRADGSFDYAPPFADPAPPFPPSLLWRSGRVSGMPLAADFNNDGAPDILHIEFGAIRALSGRNGAQVWQLDLSDTTNVNVAGCSTGGVSAYGDRRCHRRRTQVHRDDDELRRRSHRGGRRPLGADRRLDDNGLRHRAREMGDAALVETASAGVCEPVRRCACESAPDAQLQRRVPECAHARPPCSRRCAEASCPQFVAGRRRRLPDRWRPPQRPCEVRRRCRMPRGDRHCRRRRPPMPRNAHRRRDDRRHR